jgi:RNA polymerase sigma-70 factor (ECF subfamily)
LVGDASSSVDATVELASNLSIAFLVVLERLSPEERAAFLLREVFESDYSEIAQVLGKSEAACRQIASRARRRVHEQKPRVEVSTSHARRCWTASFRLESSECSAAHRSRRVPAGYVQGLARVRG